MTDHLPPGPNPCDWHIGDDGHLGYLAWHAKAERSHRAGVRQTRCPGCSRFFFPWERLGEPPVPGVRQPRRGESPR